jgi:hypothetical protein
VTLGNGDVVDACTYEAPNWIAGFLRTKGTGEEEMHFLVNSNLFDHHSFSFADIWFTWYATRHAISYWESSGIPWIGYWSLSE